MRQRRGAAPDKVPVVVSEATNMLRACLTTLVWFTLNISMASLTKYIYLTGEVCLVDAGIQQRCLKYKFPFMITVMHMASSWTVCACIRRSRSENNGVLDLRGQCAKVVPLAAVFAVSVVLGNLSLTYIYPSFNQMLASVSPLVTVIMSILMHRKRYNYWTWISMPVICGGLLVCSTEEVNYNLLGVGCVVGATVLRAVKSVMQEKLLAKSLDSVSLLYYMAPWAGLFLLLLSLAFEGAEPINVLLVVPGVEKIGVFRVLVLLAMSGANACFLNISGNVVTALWGAVMLQILGNVKACLSIIVSVCIFRNPVTEYQGLGVAICLFGVWVYNRKGGTLPTPGPGPGPVVEPLNGVARPSNVAANATPPRVVGQPAVNGASTPKV